MRSALNRREGPSKKRRRFLCFVIDRFSFGGIFELEALNISA
jgi:hypothetical protein